MDAGIGAGGLGPPSFVTLGPTELAYRKIGQGPSLLLVHGYPLSGHTFRHIVPALSPHFTCYIPDLPGAGETRWSEQTDFRFPAQADTLLQFTRAMEMGAYAIFAHDTGGTIARRLASSDIGNITKLVLLGTEIPNHRPPWIELFQKIGNPKSSAVFQFLLSRRWFRRSSAGFGGCFKDVSLIDGAFFTIFLEPLIKDKRRASGQTRYLLGIDWNMVDGMATEHARITVPTLLIWGEEDTVFPVEAARPMAAQLPDCRGFVVIPNGRLFVHEEQPEAVIKLVRDFIRET